MAIYRITKSLGCESVFEFPQSHVHSRDVILTPRVINSSFDRLKKEFDLGDFRFWDLEIMIERLAGSGAVTADSGVIWTEHNGVCDTNKEQIWGKKRGNLNSWWVKNNLEFFHGMKIIRREKSKKVELLWTGQGQSALVKWWWQSSQHSYKLRLLSWPLRRK